MARIEHRPWRPIERRYRIYVDVSDGIITMHAMTRWGAQRKAQRLDRMADKYRTWETR